MQQTLFYDWVRYILLFGLGGAMKEAEIDHYLFSDLITTVFVEQTLASPGSANNPQ